MTNRSAGGQAAYLSTREPTAGSAAATCLAAPPRTAPYAFKIVGRWENFADASVTDSRASETSSPRPRPGLPAAGRPRRTAQHAVQVRQIGDADRDRFALVVAGFGAESGVGEERTSADLDEMAAMSNGGDGHLS